MSPFHATSGGTGSSPAWLLLALLGLVWPGMVFAQVAVYDVDFHCEDEQSINFAFFDGGFLAVDLVTGSASFLLTFKEVRDGVLRPCFLRAEDCGQVFTAVRDRERRTVVRAVSHTATASTHYLAMGRVDEPIRSGRPGAGLEVEIASELRGQVLSSDDESDVDFQPGARSIGFAGIASFQLRLNRDLTREENRRAHALPQAVLTLVRQLELLGFHEDLSSTEAESSQAD